MALSTKVLTFTANTGTGTQDLTGTSFTPKAAIVWHSRATTAVDTFTEAAAIGFGFTDGTTSMCTTMSSIDNLSISNSSHTFRNDAIIQVLQVATSAGTVDGTATFSSWLSNGMQINWSDAPGAAFKFHVLFLGGSDITNVKVGEIDLPATASGDFDITDVGFQPDGLMFLAPGEEETIPLAATAMTPMMIGAATDSSHGWSQTINVEHSRPTSDTWCGFSHTYPIFPCDEQSGAYSSGPAHGATFVSMLSNGFRINYSSSPGADTRGEAAYIAFKGCSIAVGNATEPANTGDQTITTNKDTKAVMVFGVGANTANTATAHTRMTIGAGTSSSEMATVAIMDTDNAGYTICVSRYETDSIYLDITANATASSSTVNDEASLSSVSSTGFVLNWSNIGSARPFRYIAFGSSAPVALLEETVTVSAGSVARIPTYSRPPSESSVSLSESLARIQTRRFALSESSINVDQTLARTYTSLKPISETSVQIPLETIARIQTRKFMLSESAISTGELLTGTSAQEYDRPISETTVSISEQLARIQYLLKSISDPSVSTDELLTAAFAYVRTVTEDGISASATPIGLLRSTRAISQTVTVPTETVARIQYLLKSISDPAIETGELLTSAFFYVRTAAEAQINVNETLEKLWNSVRSIAAQTVTVPTETLARIQYLARGIPEQTVTVSAGDILRLIQRSKAISETVTIPTETITRIQYLIKSLSESVTVLSPETIQRIQYLLRSIPETEISASAVTQANLLLQGLIVEPRIKWYYSLLTRKIPEGEI